VHYRREIDGLRALAVLPVILFHAGVPGFSGGYVGVDVFFVISGYLITALILTELDGGHFSLADFYARRARRILPALLTVILACLPLAWLWMTPNQLRDFFQSIAAVALFSSNLLFWSEDGYFATAAEEKPLLHTWSLAVEEQYYLLFPLLMLLGWRHARGSLPLAIALLAAASFALAEWSSRHLGGEIFYLPQLRVWELMLGALAALYLHRRAPLAGAAGAASALAGLAAIGYAVHAYHADTPFPSAWTLLPTAGTALVILGAAPGNLAGRLLGLRALVLLGLLSYSAYLWHHPLFAFARVYQREEPSTWLLAGLGLLALGLAWLSWRYVEQPCRDRRRLPRNRALAFAALVGFQRDGPQGMHAELELVDGRGIPDAAVDDQALPAVLHRQFTEHVAQQGATLRAAAVHHQDTAVTRFRQGFADLGVVLVALHGGDRAVEGCDPAVALEHRLQHVQVLFVSVAKIGGVVGHVGSGAL